MKKKMKNIGMTLLKVIPICASIMLTTVVNSTACWGVGQDELPTGSKKYRKF